MKTKITRYVLMILFSLFISLSLTAQNRALPDVDVAHESYAEIKSKLDLWLENEKQFEDENHQEEYEFKKSRFVRKWLNDARDHIDAEGYLRNYAANNFNEYLKIKHQRILGDNTPLLSSGGAWFAKAASTVVAGPSTNQRRGIGRINSFALDPFSAFTYYIGAAEGGLWKTTNSGTTWTCLTNGIPVPGVAAIAVNPLNPSTIYILTGGTRINFAFGINSSPTIGVLVTHDGGDNWFTTGLTYNATSGILPYDLKIAPLDTTILLCALSSGLRRSANAGQSWSTIVSSTAFFDIEFKPGTSRCYATSSNNIWISTNNGSSFSAVNSNNYSPTKPIDNTVIDLSVTSANTAYVYALMQDADTSYVYLSTDSGTTFIQKSIISTFMNYQAGYGYGIAASKLSPNSVFVGNTAISLSTDAGSTWNIVADYTTGNASTFVHEDVHEITTRLSNEIFVIGDGGLFRSANGGSTWDFISQSLNITEFMGFGGTPTDPNLFVGGTWDNGMQKLSGTTFTNFAYADQGDGMIDPNNTNILYFTNENGFTALWRSLDGGATYTAQLPFAGCNCDDTLRSPSSKIIQMNLSNPNTIYSMYRDFYVSFDNGTNWTRRISGSTTAHQAFAQAPTDTTRFYAIRGNQVYGSANSGVTWQSLYTFAGGVFMLEISADASSSNTCYFACTGYDALNKVFKIVWNGTGAATTTNISSGLPNLPVYKVISQSSPTQGIYAATELGVYFRSNSTGQWIEFSNGLPYCKVVDLEINYPNGLISAATYGRGIWQSPLYAVCPVDYNHGPILLNPSIYGSEYFEASNSITSARHIFGGYGTNVTFNSGNYVQLDVGFEVTAGSMFNAYIDGCSNPVPIQLNGIFAGYMRDEKEAKDFLAAAKINLDKNKIIVFPNPASSMAQVFFNLGGESKVELALHDQQGRLLKNVFDQTLSGNGINAIPLDVSDLSGGIYFCVLKTGNNIQSEKLIVIKK